MIMKTPKEKAKEMVERFTKHVHECSNSEARQCALIVVDEIINCDSFFKTLEDTKIFSKYWHDVQTEINNL